MRASVRGAAVGIPPFMHLGPNRRQRATGQCQSGSLTGAVASQIVTEARKGPLRTVGNRPGSARVQAGSTARRTGRAGTKVGSSDPAAQSGMAVAQRIKGTPGITG